MKTLVSVFQLIPSLVGVIQSFEAAVPLPQQGKAKLDAVLQIVGGIAGEISKDLLPAVTTAINVIVGLFNATGVFRKTV